MRIYTHTHEIHLPPHPRNPQRTASPPGQCRPPIAPGLLHKNPSQRGYHLTTKVNQKTLTKYVPLDLVPQVRAMTRNHLKLRRILARLSQVNWQLLQSRRDQ